MLMWSYLQLGVMGTCTAFAPNYASYCVFRFAGGMALSGFGLSIACLGKGTWGQPGGLGWGHGRGHGGDNAMAMDGDIPVAMEVDNPVAVGGDIPGSTSEDITVAMVGSPGVDVSDHAEVAALTRRVPAWWGHPQ